MKINHGSVSFPSLLWILILSLVLSACSFPLGQGSGAGDPVPGNKQNANHPGNTDVTAEEDFEAKLFFKGSFPIELTGPDSGYLARNVYGDVYNGSLYLLAEYRIENADPVCWLYVVDGDTGKAEKKELTLPEADNCHITSLDLLPDGTLSLCRYNAASEEKSLIKLDRQGSVLSQEIFPDAERYPWNPESDSEDSQGVFDDLTVGTVIAQPDSNAGTLTLRLFDPENGALEKLASLQGNFLTGLCADGEDAFCCAIDGKILRYDRKKDVSEPLLNLYDNGIFQSTFFENCLFFNEAKDLVVCAMNENTPTLYLFSDEETTAESEILLAEIFPQFTQEINRLAARFSKTHTQTPIRTEKISEEDAERLYIDMATGKEGPEILFLPEEDYLTLREQGLLMDLTELIPEETKEQIFPAVLQLGTYNDKLTGIAPWTIFSSMVASEKVCPEGSWSLENFWKQVEKQEDSPLPLLFAGEQPGYYALFYEVFFWDPSRFIDVEKGTCDFDNDDFRRILEFCKKYGVSETTMDVDAAEMLQSGQSLADVVTSAIGLYSFTNALREYGDDFHITGLPADSASKMNSLAKSSAGYLAVSAGAVHIDEIRAFLTEFLSFDCQSELRSPMIPLRKDVVQAIPLPEEYAEGLSEAEKEKLLLHWEQMKEEYIRMAENSVPYQGQVWGTILGPELSDYFNGVKDLDETIRVITNRIQLYLDENK